MNKELIKQQLDAFEGLLKTSRRIALTQSVIPESEGDKIESKCRYAIAEEYINSIEYFSMVKCNILKLMEDTNNE